MSLLALAPAAQAKGMLGESFIGVAATVTRPGSDLVRQIDDKAWGVAAVVNAPVHENLDLTFTAEGTWLRGDLMGFAASTEGYAVRASVTGHLRPGATVDPYIRGGILYAHSRAKVAWLGASVEGFGPIVTAGAQFTLGEKDCLIGSVTYHNVIDNEIAVAGTYNHWFNETVGVSVELAYGIEGQDIGAAVGAVFAF